MALTFGLEPFTFFICCFFIYQRRAEVQRVEFEQTVFCDWYHLDKDSHEHNNIFSWKGKTDDLVI